MLLIKFYQLVDYIENQPIIVKIWKGKLEYEIEADNATDLVDLYSNLYVKDIKSKNNKVLVVLYDL